MKFGDIRPEDRLGKDYREHKIFEDLKYYSDFYDSISFSIMNWIPQGTTAMLNLDTYTYSSIHGTLESIRLILKKGRINDSYALLRKYYDSTIINIYTNLYLQDNFSIDNFIVTQIENWRKGTETIPEYRVISKYIKDSERLKPISSLLDKNDTYKKIRNRCNDHTHYNFYRNFLLNDNQIHNENRVKYLDILSSDLEKIFIQHFSYIFYLNEHYMMSSDYIDSLDCDMQPEENSQYWVAPFIQKIFDELLEIKSPDIVAAIKENSDMQLK